MRHKWNGASSATTKMKGNLLCSVLVSVLAEINSTNNEFENFAVHMRIAIDRSMHVVYVAMRAHSTHTRTKREKFCVCSIDFYARNFIYNCLELSFFCGNAFDNDFCFTLARR